MAKIYKTPGVYVEEVSNLAPSVAGVATAIPAFVGCTQISENNSPVRISSLLEYVSFYGEGPSISFEGGKLQNAGYVMYDSLRLFFANGGKTCYIVSVGSMTAAPDTKVYTAAIDSLEEVDEVTLVSCPDAALLYKDDDLATIQQSMLAHCAKMKDRVALLDVVDVATFRDKIGTTGLSYGAAYYPSLKSSFKADVAYKTVVDYLVANKKIETTSPEYTALADYEEAVKAVAAAEKKLKDGKGKEPDTAATEAYDSSVKTRDAAILAMKNIQSTNAKYAAAVAAIQDVACVITPSAAVAGAIVSSDNTVGVWQAPANISLSGIKDVVVNVTNDAQEDLNVHESGKSINAIRKFSGKGILIWGARTLDGYSNEWRYISVRRLFNYIEESVQKSTSWALFQPNDTNTWVKLKSQISSFLTSIWRSGALAGATPDDAFFVNVGKDITMSQDDINNGNLIIQVGIAAVRPAEFIILEFSHKVQQ